MKYFLFLLFTSLFSFFTRQAAGQSVPTYCYNLNIENGMPDNQIYRMNTDKFGYLWIGTPRGVARYNGYDYKTFTLADGLPSDDVWDLYEDNKGKIWLGSITSDFGYIYNNKYYKTVLNNGDRSFYPSSICPKKKGGIYVVSGRMGASNRVSIERHDSILHCGYHPPPRVDTHTFNAAIKWAEGMPSGHLAVGCLGNLYAGTLPETPGDTMITLRYIAKIPEQVAAGTTKDRCKLNGNYLIYRNDNRDHIEALNVQNGAYSVIDLRNYVDDEKIRHVYPDTYNRYFYAICDRTIVKLDTGLHFIRKYQISDLITSDEEAADGNKLRTVLQNSFWKNCLGTTTSGVFINNEIGNHFTKRQFDLKNYQYIGRANDSISLWWNSPKKTLIKIAGTNKISQFKYNTNTDRFFKAMVAKNGAILIAGAEMYELNNETGSLIRKTPFSALMYDFAEIDTNTFLIASNVGILKWEVATHKSPDRYLYTINEDRYDHIIKDSLTGDCWAYNKGKIFIHKPDGSHKIVTRDSLKRFGIQRIEKILIDNTYGNIFLKGHNSLLLYSRETNTFRRLFDDYNLEGALIDVYNNGLIVAGRFGVLFSKINGKNTLTHPILYCNLRDISYRQVTDLFPYANKLLLQTDKGLFEMPVPSNDMLANAPSLKNDQYRFILNYRDTVKSIENADTLLINQLDKKLQFDIINPNGNGRVKYFYRITGSREWRALNANEITLPPWFEPDRYYDLYLIAQDNVWKSSPLKLKVYVIPYWWQTTLGHRSLWAAAILSIIFVLASSILITRKLVLRATQKRHLRMELELKAIYSQINPHFIFNTLNSALLLVSKNKMEDAYTHISKFSRLLRSYIKSSRNKYISIDDEIDNLEDYIELQQTRFKNKFSYEIIVSPAINPAAVKIPALLLQPFVENAINHGILPKEHSGHLKIEFTRNEEKDEIVCIVEDDGVGRKSSDPQPGAESSRKGKESYGDLLIKDLVSIFNKYEHMNIAIEYLDKEEPLTGTVVYIQIRYPHHGK